MSDLLGMIGTWAAEPGVPNGLLVVALLTSPAEWSRAASRRVGAALDRAAPVDAGSSRSDESAGDQESEDRR